MGIFAKSVSSSRAAVFLLAAFLVAGCSMMGAKGSGDRTASATEMTGAQEAPPVSSSGSGKSTIRVASDKSVSGTVTVSGFTPTVAHIHTGARGVSGPVIIPLKKDSDSSFSVPPGTKLSDAQYAEYMAGKLYVNVHSAAHPGGEVRAQLTSK
jgi:hypothetical protein